MANASQLGCTRKVMLATLPFALQSRVSGKPVTRRLYLEPLPMRQAAVVPGAKVTVTNPRDWSFPHRDHGRERAHSLFRFCQSVHTSLTVEQTGFRKYERRDIVLQANENAQADAAMQVGNVQETVTVERNRITGGHSFGNPESHVVDSKQYRRTPVKRP